MDKKTSFTGTVDLNLHKKHAELELAFTKLLARPGVTVVAILPSSEFIYNPRDLDYAVRLFSCRASDTRVSEKRVRRDLKTESVCFETIDTTRQALAACAEAFAHTGQEYVLLVHVDGDEEVQLFHSQTCDELALGELSRAISDELVWMLS